MTDPAPTYRTDPAGSTAPALDADAVADVLRFLATHAATCAEVGRTVELPGSVPMFEINELEIALHAQAALLRTRPELADADGPDLVAAADLHTRCHPHIVTLVNAYRTVHHPSAYSPGDQYELEDDGALSIRAVVDENAGGHRVISTLIPADWARGWVASHA